MVLQDKSVSLEPWVLLGSWVQTLKKQGILLSSVCLPYFFSSISFKLHHDPMKLGSIPLFYRWGN